MIKISLAPEPKNFEKLVNAPGLDALREMIGEAPLKKRPGPGRKKIADTYQEIPSNCFPEFWQKAIPDMLAAYGRTCAYMAVHIWPATGTATVDHVAAKSLAWDKIYEWDNYRLACGLMNSRKNKFDDVYDPVNIEDGLFSMEFSEFELIPGPLATVADLPAISSTIERLNLNSLECCKARGGYVTEYKEGHIDFDFLTRKAPFVALEMYRHGHIHAVDAAEADVFLKARAKI